MKYLFLNAKCIYSLILCMLISINYYAQTPSPVLCFDFSGNLSSTDNTVNLTSIGNLGTYTSDTTICNDLGALYKWDISTGLELHNPDDYFPQNNYTIELLFKFTTQPYPSSWQKIVDFKNQTSDMGLYLYNNNLQMYGQYTRLTPALYIS